MKTSLSIDAATQLSRFMDTLNDKQAPDEACNDAYFTLLDLKQHMIDTEHWELTAELRNMEQQHGLFIPFYDLEGELVKKES